MFDKNNHKKKKSTHDEGISKHAICALEVP